MKTILIVDDEQMILTGLRRIIERDGRGFQLAGSAEDAETALLLVEGNKPDVMLTDISMPGMDGLTLIERAHALHPGMISVVLSGHDDFEYARTALRLGATDYLLKPISSQQLCPLLDKLRAACEARDEAQDRERQLVYYQQRELDTGERERPSGSAVDVVRQYIREHYAEDVTLAIAAAQVYMSPKYLSELFKRESGSTFSEYLSLVRMERAKALLKNPRYKVYEVAEMVGYQTLSHFNHIFKDETGMTPKEYRNQTAGKSARNLDSGTL